MRNGKFETIEEIEQCIRSIYPDPDLKFERFEGRDDGLIWSVTLYLHQFTIHTKDITGSGITIHYGNSDGGAKTISRVKSMKEMLWLIRAENEATFRAVVNLAYSKIVEAIFELRDLKGNNNGFRESEIKTIIESWKWETKELMNPWIKLYRELRRWIDKIDHCQYYRLRNYDEDWYCCDSKKEV